MMLVNKTVLPLLLATLIATNVHSHPHPSPECMDTPGVVYVDNGNCTTQYKYQHHWYWGGWWQKEYVCAEYTCENLSCDLEFAKLKCPETCGNCITIVDVIGIDCSFTILAGFLARSGLVPYLEGPDVTTVFAPTDDAFENLTDIVDNYGEPQWIEHLKALLSFHILQGWVSSDYLRMHNVELQTLGGNIIKTTSFDPLKINGLEVLSENITTTNGIIHALGGVLLPPSSIWSAYDLISHQSWHYHSGEFARLIDIAEYSGLLSSLDPLGAITMFVPTNEAFYKIHGVIDETNKTQVQELIQYHVLSGILLAKNITDGLVATAGNQEELEFSKYGDHIKINDKVMVTHPDILVSNGVIHLIDGVLLPPGFCEDTDETYMGYTCEAMAKSPYKHKLCSDSTNCPETCGKCG